jgi:hypothetical protein
MHCQAEGKGASDPNGQGRPARVGIILN